jgi:nucleoside-diphosphate-sugar epimerase
MRVLVTGANGLLGAVVGKSLQLTGHEVLLTGRRENDDLPTENYLTAELTRSEDIQEVFRAKEFDAIVHCAAVIKGSSGQDYHSNNVLATYNLARAARDFGVSKFLFMSTISVYEGDGPFDETSGLVSSGDYAISKIASEHSLRLMATENFKIISLRLAGLHGANRQGGVLRKMIDTSLAQGTLIVDEPDTVFSFTFLEDAGPGVEKLLSSSWKQNWQAINFANPGPLDLSEVAELVRVQFPYDVPIELGGKPSRNRVLLIDKMLAEHQIRMTSAAERISSIAASNCLLKTNSS